MGSSNIKNILLAVILKMVICVLQSPANFMSWRVHDDSVGPILLPRPRTHSTTSTKKKKAKKKKTSLPTYLEKLKWVDAKQVIFFMWPNGVVFRRTQKKNNNKTNAYMNAFMTLDKKR